MNRNTLNGILFISICLIATAFPVIAKPIPLDLTLSPETVNISTFFSGEKLTISGEISSDDDIVIEVSGHDSKNEYDLKGRRSGLWMTTGQVHIDQVPQLYILLLPQGKDWEHRIESLGLGLLQLKSRMKTSSTGKMPLDIFNMFINLKKSQALYDEVFQATTYSSAVNGKKQFTSVCTLPSSIRPGKYTIKATTITHTGEEKSVMADFAVEEVGFIKLVSTMSDNRRILYGVTAVVIALLAGLIMGILFKQSGGSH
ncbi:TIGR02186 family protein [Desulfobacula sp.]